MLVNVGYDEVRRRQAAGRENGEATRYRRVIGLEPGGRNAARDMAIFPESKQMPGAGGVEGARVKLEKNGSIVFTLGSTSCGQSHETTASQIIADVLGVRPDRVATSGTFDSALSPWGVASSNSGNNFHLYDVGAIHGAATRLRDRVCTLAAHVLGVEQHSLRIEDGVVYAGGGARADDTAHADGAVPANRASVTFAELGKVAYANQAQMPVGFEGGLEATYYHTHPHANPLMLPDMQGRVRAQYTFSSAAHAAVVEVDRETGRVRVQRYVIVSDNGTLINPSVVGRTDLRFGGTRHSVALGEGFVYGDDAQLLTLTLLDYGKSTTLETPRVEIEHYPVPDPLRPSDRKRRARAPRFPLRLRLRVR